MSSEVATRGNNLPANPSDLLAGLQNQQVTASADPGGGSGGLFMNFRKGKYSIGPERLKVEAGSQWAVNPSSFVLGYHAWSDASELLGQSVAGINQPPIIKSSLPDVGADWDVYREFTLVCVSGEDSGVQCSFGKTSLGFRKAAEKLLGEVIAQLGTDPGNPVALIELKIDSYEHSDKKIGEVFNPIFEVVGWADMEATSVPEDNEPEESEEEFEELDPDDGGDVQYSSDDTDADADDADDAEARQTLADGVAASLKKALAKRGRASTTTRRGESTTKPAEGTTTKPARRRQRRG